MLLIFGGKKYLPAAGGKDTFSAYPRAAFGGEGKNEISYRLCADAAAVQK